MITDKEPKAIPATVRNVLWETVITYPTVRQHRQQCPSSAGSSLVATVTVMITSFDDYPIHQTSEPIAHTESGDPGAYDRYFFNGYSRDGKTFFAAAMGLYPNRHVIDASFSVVRNGEQVNVHSSGRAPVDRMECNVVGPIKVEVVTPMKKHRITVDAPEHAIRADITFEASSLPYEEPPFLVRAGNRKAMSYTRLTQLGTWTGWIEVDGVRTELVSGDIVGSPPVTLNSLNEYCNSASHHFQKAST